VAGKYSGNFVRVWASAQESANFAPDPAHATPRDHAGGTPQEYPTTDQVYAGTGSEFAGSEFPVDMVVGGGSILGTPSRSHDGRGGRKMVYTDEQHREQLTDLHDEDGQRRYVQHEYTLPPEQDATEVYYDTYRESDPIYGTPNNTGAVGPMRGIDGNPQNNPTTHMYPRYGMRPGWERLGPFMDAARRLGRRRYIYNPQPLVQRDYYKPINQPAVPGAGPDIGPFQLWKQAGTLTAQNVKRPAIYREPLGLDASFLAQEQAATTATIGGGLAG